MDKRRIPFVFVTLVYFDTYDDSFCGGGWMGGWKIGPFPGICPTNTQSTKKEFFLILC